MPCCAPRYGALIVAGIDFCAGVTGLILLLVCKNSKLLIVSATFPAIVLTFLGVLLSIAFLKKIRTLATAGLIIKTILIVACGATIIVLLVHPELKKEVYMPVYIAGLFYTIVLQFHFSWVLYDFRNRRHFHLRHHHETQFQNIQ